MPIAIGGQPYRRSSSKPTRATRCSMCWNDFYDSVIMLLLFSGQAILLIYLFIGRALRPLYRLATALELVGQGDFGTRSPGACRGVARLRDNFTGMAAPVARRFRESPSHRAAADGAGAGARRYRPGPPRRGGPLSVRHQYRCREFARLLREGRASEAAEQLTLIGDGVGHIQRELRRAVRRLQPAGLAEFGLRDAIGE